LTKSFSTAAVILAASFFIYASFQSQPGTNSKKPGLPEGGGAPCPQRQKAQETRRAPRLGQMNKPGTGSRRAPENPAGLRCASPRSRHSAYVTDRRGPEPDLGDGAHSRRAAAQEAEGEAQQRAPGGKAAAGREPDPVAADGSHLYAEAAPGAPPHREPAPGAGPPREAGSGPGRAIEDPQPFQPRFTGPHVMMALVPRDEDLHRVTEGPHAPFGDGSDPHGARGVVHLNRKLSEAAALANFFRELFLGGQTGKEKKFPITAMC
ncbi:hypothetical protein Celaphus_00005877, partial [Cervus elaphus hippelaphus]